MVRRSFLCETSEMNKRYSFPRFFHAVCAYFVYRCFVSPPPLFYVHFPFSLLRATSGKYGFYPRERLASEGKQELPLNTSIFSKLYNLRLPKL